MTVTGCLQVLELQKSVGIPTTQDCSAVNRGNPPHLTYIRQKNFASLIFSGLLGRTRLFIPISLLFLGLGLICLSLLVLLVFFCLVFLVLNFGLLLHKGQFRILLLVSLGVPAVAEFGNFTPVACKIPEAKTGFWPPLRRPMSTWAGRNEKGFEPMFPTLSPNVHSVNVAYIIMGSLRHSGIVHDFGGLAHEP